MILYTELMIRLTVEREQELIELLPPVVSNTKECLVGVMNEDRLRCERSDSPLGQHGKSLIYERIQERALAHPGFTQDADLELLVEDARESPQAIAPSVKSGESLWIPLRNSRSCPILVPLLDDFPV